MLCSALWCYRVPITHYRPLLPAPRFNVTHACGGKVLRTHPYLQACKYGCAQVSNYIKSCLEVVWMTKVYVKIIVNGKKMLNFRVSQNLDFS